MVGTHLGSQHTIPILNDGGELKCFGRKYSVFSAQCSIVGVSIEIFTCVLKNNTSFKTSSAVPSPFNYPFTAQSGLK